MKILDRDYQFLLSVKARREIRALCPNGNIERLSEYLDGAEMEERITQIIIILSKGYEDYQAFWESRSGRTYEPQPITEELIENLSMEDYRTLQREAMDAFRRGMGITVETEEPKDESKKNESAEEVKPS